MEARAQDGLASGGLIRPRPGGAGGAFRAIRALGTAGNSSTGRALSTAMARAKRRAAAPESEAAAGRAAPHTVPQTPPQRSEGAAHSQGPTLALFDREEQVAGLRFLRILMENLCPSGLRKVERVFQRLETGRRRGATILRNFEKAVEGNREAYLVPLFEDFLAGRDLSASQAARDIHLHQQRCAPGGSLSVVSRPNSCAGHPGCGVAAAAWVPGSDQWGPLAPVGERGGRAK